MNNKTFDFKEILDSICECYSDDVKNLLPKFDDFNPLIYSDSNINEVELKSFIDKVQNSYHKSVAQRILAIIKLQEARDKTLNIDIVEVWNLIYYQ